jgi:hypothetical protein
MRPAGGSKPSPCVAFARSARFDEAPLHPFSFAARKHSGKGTRGKPLTRRAPKKISIVRLPVTGSDVFGREEDIAFLDRAWANKDVNVVS